MPRDFSDQFSFGPYIGKILTSHFGKSSDSNIDITNSAKNELNLILHYVAEKFITFANQMVFNRHEKTMKPGDIVSSARIIFAGQPDLMKQAINAIERSMMKYKNSGKTSKSTKISTTKKAELTISVSRVKNIIRTHMKNDRLNYGTAVCLASVLEMLADKILISAGNLAKDQKKIRITTRHITIAINTDEELNMIFKDIVTSGGIVNK
jgi:histone H3/H4